MNQFVQSLELFFIKWIWSGKYKAGKLIFSTIFLGLLLNIFFFPGGLKNIDILFKNWPTSAHVNTIQIIELQHEDLTKHLLELNIPQEDHRFKMTYRLFLPLLSRLIGIQYFFWKVFFIQLALLPLFVLFLFQWLSFYFKNPFTLFLFLIPLSSTYYLSAFWQDIFLYGDSIAFFLLLLCLRFNHPALLFSCAFLASWIDERAFVSLFGILSWWGMFQFSKDDWTWKKMVNAPFFAILLAILGYTTTRILLQINFFPPSFFPLHSLIDEFISTLYENVKCLGFSLWRGYKGTLGFVSLFILLNLQDKQYLRTFGFVSLFILSSLFAMGAYDLSRGLSYFFPFILFSLIEIRRYWSEQDMRLMLFFLLLFTLTCSNLSFFRLPGSYPLY